MTHVPEEVLEDILPIKGQRSQPNKHVAENSLPVSNMAVAIAVRRAVAASPGAVAVRDWNHFNTPLVG